MSQDDQIYVDIVVKGDTARQLQAEAKKRGCTVPEVISKILEEVDLETNLDTTKT